ncbi:hypothetical protein Gasu2_54550 [Galdieria sulphuraria]|uniref:Uncharacterized protein n=1 Tax=Galdieria sulphuraria TaxID=130081 RepID=M2XV19_GALSU|nr:uncharacterized protein Gasu_51140 [Galdieria sulphuraria]EME27254.1 hypothetical protein Gasu_51140 [Galdieria sulphuraria]GJD11315.1 hypothetical protein Gasu2_54550 [Galdieria sulphuraria]|eukprot:XP_005703774.1 hypothetical protein Gasu_51140 [Galdieria sulphuraria]
MKTTMDVPMQDTHATKKKRFLETTISQTVRFFVKHCQRSKSRSSKIVFPSKTSTCKKFEPKGIVSGLYYV